VLSFQNKHLFVFYDQQLKLSNTKKFGSMNEAITWVATSRKQVTNRLCIAIFSCKMSFKSK